MYKISIINDEISDNLSGVAEFLHEQKIKYVELRSICKRNILSLPLNDLRKHSDYLRKNKISVSCIASPILKWLPEEANVSRDQKSKVDSFYFKEPNNNNLEKVFKIADIFDTKYIRIFSFLRYEDFEIKHLKSSIDRLKNLAEKYNKILLIENEPACNIQTIKDLNDFMKVFGDKRLRVLFDIGNLYKNNDLLTEKGLEKIKDFIEYIHIKDYSFQDRKYVPLGRGNINYKSFISWLKRAYGNKLFYSLETHAGEDNKRNNSEISVKILKELLKQKRVRYGIVGCGRIFNKHVEAIKASNKSELIGVYDIKRVKMLEEAKNNDCKHYENVEELINDVDVVNICTPHNTHIELIKKVIERSKKCLCEKPGGISEKEIGKAIRSKKYNNNVFVVYQNRFNKPILKFEELIRNSKFGHLLYVFGNVRWFRDANYYKNSWQGKKKLEGGMLFNQGIHILDIMMKHFAKGTETKIIGAYKDKIYHKKIDTEDIFLAQFKNKNTIFNLEITVSASPCNFGSSLLYIFKNGRARISGMSLNESLDVHISGKDSYNLNFVAENEDVYGYGHKVLIDKISEFVLTRKRDKNLVDLGTASQRVKFINRLYSAVQ